jgi:hypothetical protein
MRSNVEKPGIGLFELIFYLVGVLLLIVLATLVANGQNKAPARGTTKAHAEAPQPLYKEYRGVRLGMTAVEVRAKLGDPTLKSDEQDFFVISANETAQIAYDTALKVVTISTDYAGGIGAPDYRTAVGEGMLLTRPDGSVFKMAMYDAERFWVSYNKSAGTVPTVTITIGAYK